MRDRPRAPRHVVRPGARRPPGRARARPRVLGDAGRAGRRRPRAARAPRAGRRDAIDRVAEAFARVVDAKSPFTARHSGGVADIAAGLARELDLGAAQERRLHRAGLLHDVGKLGVSSAILDKPGRLDAGEWAAIRRHPEWSLQILQRVPAFVELAHVAASHHERLDGSGYFRGLGAEQLDLPSRILAVADVAEALSSERPYREALPADEVLAIMRVDAGVTLDAEAFAALEGFLPRWSAPTTGLAPTARSASTSTTRARAAS